ncbi:MAG: hypothetical protein HC859_04850 [Bacteroidia bacterium]|nr:hypothetical protein [Bacteroidia bacterium]
MLQPGMTYQLEQINSSEAVMNFTGDDDMTAFMQAKVGKLPVKIFNNQKNAGYYSYESPCERFAFCGRVWRGHPHHRNERTSA